MTARPHRDPRIPARGPGTIRQLSSIACGVLLLAAAAAGRAADPVAATAAVERRVEGRIAGKASLSGQVRVTGDLLVLPGALLSIAPGTVLSFDRSESSKVDPEYFFGGTEMVIRGRVEAEGAEFRFPERTGGIVVDGGALSIARSGISGAEAGILVTGGGKVETGGPVRVSGCRVGVALEGTGRGGFEGEGEISVTGNSVGVVRFPGGPPIPGKIRSAGNEEADLITWDDPPETPAEEPPPGRPVPSPGALRIGDTFLDRDRTLSGDIVVEGVIRVAPAATLRIEPGSRLFFAFRDTDGDGIGENGIFLQGTLVASGTAERPIGFYPEGAPAGNRGRWDSINFMVSESGGNLLEHVEIAGAYRGLHAHFSRVAGRNLRIADCFRGIQFQESEVELSDVRVRDSGSALRCRDSNVRLARFRSIGTTTGVNILRSDATLLDPHVERPGWYGFRIRESRLALAGGEVRGGLTGISLQEGSAGIGELRVEDSGLAGIASQEGDVTMKGCRSRGSRLDGIGVTGGTVVWTGGEISGFGRHAVHLGGPAQVSLRGVVIRGGADRGEVPLFHDGKVVPGLGVVKVE